MRFLGVDPGLHGAVAALNQEGDVIFLQATPIIPFKTKKGTTRNEYNREEMLDLLRSAVGDEASSSIVGLEKVHAIPRVPGKGGKFNVCPNCKQIRGGISSAAHFTFGVGYGLWLMALSALDLKMFEIPPQRWQKIVLHGLPDRRKAGVFLAVKNLFPKLHLKKGSGEADAVLIAEYMRRTYSTRFSLDEPSNPGPCLEPAEEEDEGEEVEA